MTEPWGPRPPRGQGPSARGSELGALALELAVLGVVWYFVRLPWPMMGSLAGVLVVSHLVPERWGNVVLGVGLIGVAGLVYFQYNWPRLATLLAVVGVIFLLPAVIVLAWRGSRRLKAES